MYLCQVFHRIMHRHRSVSRCRYNLTQSLGTDISYRKDTRDIGAAGLPCFHITLGIQIYLPLQQGRVGVSSNADKHTIAGKD